MSAAGKQASRAVEETAPEEPVLVEATGPTPAPVDAERPEGANVYIPGFTGLLGLASGTFIAFTAGWARAEEGLHDELRRLGAEVR